MTVLTEIDGRQRSVELRRQGDGWSATIDGTAVAVDIRALGNRLSLLVGSGSYDVAIDDRGAGELVVTVDGRAVPVTLLRSRARRGAGALHAAGPRTITAPMPGRVVKVLVQPGDTVQARQGLVVVEAMKMENELRSPQAGTVVEVRVTEGSLVEAKAVLVVLA